MTLLIRRVDGWEKVDIKKGSAFAQMTEEELREMCKRSSYYKIKET